MSEDILMARRNAVVAAARAVVNSPMAGTIYRECQFNNDACPFDVEVWHGDADALRRLSMRLNELDLEFDTMPATPVPNPGRYDDDIKLSTFMVYVCVGVLFIILAVLAFKAGASLNG